MLHKILLSLEILALIPITGGTIVLGALIAPLIFKSAEKKDASNLMIAIFNKFDQWIKVSALLLLASFLVRSFLVSGLNMNLEALVTLAIATVSLYMVMSLSPQVNKAYSSKRKNQTEEFEKLHKRSEQLHKLNFLLGTILLIILAI